MSRGRWIDWAGAGIVVLLVVGLGALSPLPPASAARTQPIEVLVVLDVSGSMARPAGEGLSRLQAARQALAQLVDVLPEGSRVGMRVYGSEYAGANRRVSCRDTRLVVPIAPLDRHRILDAADRLRPTGDTPIGTSLKFAASDLKAAGGGGKAVIVLISDGEDNCSPPATPPCQVVQSLQREGFRVRIETVGVSLGRSTTASGALRCISGHTGGRYYDAGNAGALSAALERISSDALGVVGRGRPVPQASTLARAPLIEPGSYRLDLRPGQQAWVRFKAGRGRTPRVLATVEGLESLSVPPEARQCPAWRAQLFNPYGEGGTYPPYDNRGEFDGVGMGSTGASTTHQLDPYSQGIDFTGTWAVRLSLAADTKDTCSAALPEQHAFPVRFSLQLSPPGDAEPTAPSTSSAPSPSASSGSSPSAAGSPAGDDPELSAKYDQPVEPAGRPWLAPATAVVIAGCLLLVAAGAFLLRRRRLRGW